MIRRTLWFATAYTIVIIVHEAAHAVTASALGLETELYQFWVNIDLTNRSTIGERAAFGVMGPVASLILGAAAWFAYRVRRHTAAAMPLLYLATFGVSNFFGNLMSASFIGDFSNIATWLNVPMVARYALSAVGLICTAAVLFFAGRELAHWAPPDTSRMANAAMTLVPPIAIGTAVIILVNQPVPIHGFAAARVGESAFWIFAMAGAFIAPRTGRDGVQQLQLHWWDYAIAVAALAVVRVMALGIRLS